MNPQSPYDPNQPPPYDPNQPPSVYPPPPTPYYQQTPYGGFLPSANGSTILTIGILSFFCFGFILGPIAWVMGNSALKLIDSGQANPAERGSVEAGRICGIVSLCLHGGLLLVYGAFVILGFIAAATQSHP